MRAQSSVSVGDTTGWNAWVNSSGYIVDAAGDQQTGQTSDDFVGDASTYAAFQQKAGTMTVSGVTSDYVLWRARFDTFSGADQFGGNGGNLGLGIDVNGNGSVDLVMMMTEGSGNVNNRARTITFGTPGTGANTGPSTTSWTFPTQTAITLIVNTTYDLSAADSSIGGSQDAFLTFGISFANLQTAINTYAKDSLLTTQQNAAYFPSFQVGYDTKMSFIAYTSTQNNALNQDLAGASKNALNKNSAEYQTSFTALGAFSPMIDANGRVPEPATYVQIGVFAALTGLMAWRRRQAKRNATAVN